MLKLLGLNGSEAKAESCSTKSSVIVAGPVNDINVTVAAHLVTWLQFACVPQNTRRTGFKAM